MFTFILFLLLTLYILIFYRTSIIRLVSALANSRFFLLSFLLGSQHVGSKTKTENKHIIGQSQHNENSTIIRLKECLVSYMYLVSYTALETT